VEDALAQATRYDHILVLKQVATHMLPSERTLPIASASIRALERARTTLHWSWSTASTKAGNLAGVLKRASQYDHDATDHELSSAVIWKDYALKCDGKKKSNPPDRSASTNADELLAAVRAHPTDAALGVLISWICGGQRFNSVATLETRDVTLKDNILHVTFRRGKTIRYTGPYPGFGRLSADLKNLVATWINRRATSGFRFLLLDGTVEPSMKRIEVVTQRMRTACSIGGLRVRRGALHAMRSAGASFATLRRFSQHTTNAQLKQYIGDDPATLESEMLEASKPLAGDQHGGAGGTTDAPRPRMPTQCFLQMLLTILLTVVAIVATPAGALAAHDPRKRHVGWSMVFMENPYEMRNYDGHRNLGLPSWSEILATTGTDGAALGDPATWPLHVKQITRARIDVIRSAAARYPLHRERIEAALRPFTEETFYDAIPDSARVRPNKTCFFTDADVDIQLKADLFEKAPPGTKPKGWVRVRPNKEFSKRRRRTIYHTVTANQASRTTECVLPGMPEVIRLATAGNFAIVWDFAAFFHAFPIDECVRNNFCFVHRGTLYRLKRMAMGQSHSCDLAQAVMQLILQILKDAVPSAVGLAHVDNGIVVCQTEEDARVARDTLLAIADDLGLTLNDREAIQPTTNFTYVGVRFESW